MREQEKICSECGHEHPISAFNKQTGGKYGVRSICKKCATIQKRDWVERNREAYNAYHAAYKRKRRKR